MYVNIKIILPIKLDELYECVNELIEEEQEEQEEQDDNNEENISYIEVRWEHIFQE